MKKLFALLIILIFACLLPLSVSANAPMPADSLTVEISNIPDGAVYADLLIKIDQDDPNYIDAQKSAYGNTADVPQEIANYCEDGFRSFTLHYANAKSNIKLEKHSYDDSYDVLFCKGLEYNDYLTQYEDLRKNYRNIKIALLDKNFNIISVSNEGEIPLTDEIRTFKGIVYYDVRQNSLEINSHINPYAVVFSGFFSILIVALSVFIESATAFFFRYNSKQISMISIVNLCTQITMRILYLVLPFTYLIETIMLETLVYSSEFLIYKKRFKELKTGNILTYTIIANTLSLVIGILIDGFIF